MNALNQLLSLFEVLTKYREIFESVAKSHFQKFLWFLIQRNALYLWGMMTDVSKYPLFNLA